MATRRKKVASPYADGRGSKVNPDLDDAMKGKGGKRPPKKVKPKAKPKIKRLPTRAEEMDKGLRLKKLKKKQE